VSSPTADFSAGGNQSPPDVPDFDLIRRIGEGGFGQVWLAANRTTGQLRAVKVIPLCRSDRADRAGREITSLTRLEANLRRRHPNLLNIHHVGKTTDHLFYTMDAADDVSGTSASLQSDYQPATLRSRLEGGPLPPEECLRCAQQLLAGLAWLHESGMVHRDVKPSNCLFVDGELKLADFGLLTEADAQVSRVGTQTYMPPDGRMDFRADVYAAGLVIYEMLTGLPADSFPSLGARGREVAEDPSLSTLNRLVLQACQPDPQERFQDAGRMLAELAPPEPPTETQKTPTRRRLAVSAGLVALTLLVALAAWWATRPGRVHVNFITEPYEATIYLDGRQLLDPKGKPYRTPCSVPDLSAEVHHVVFKLEGRENLDAGRVDFAKAREIIHRWSTPP